MNTYRWITLTAVILVHVHTGALGATLEQGNREPLATLQSFLMGHDPWTIARRMDITRLAAGGNANLENAMNNWPGLDNMPGNADDAWTLAAAAPLPGTFTPRIYQARSGNVGENNELVNHITGGANLVLDYRDGVAGANRPANLRWIQVITTNMPRTGEGMPNMPYMDRGGPPAARTLARPLYYQDNATLNANSNIAPDIDFRFQDAPGRSVWRLGADGDRNVVVLGAQQATWTAELWGVTWNGTTPNEPANAVGRFDVHDGVRWGFEVFPADHRRVRQIINRLAGMNSPDAMIVDQACITWDGSGLSFANLKIQDGNLDDGSPISPGDPVLGANVLVGNAPLTTFPVGDFENAGDYYLADTEPGLFTRMPKWFFDETTLKLAVDHDGSPGTPDLTVLTADLVANILFEGSEQFPMLNSEFHGRLANVQVNNTIGSQFLAGLQSLVAMGTPLQLALHSDLLSNGMDGLTLGPKTGKGFFRIGVVPEPATLSLLLFCLAALLPRRRHR